MKKFYVMSFLFIVCFLFFMITLPSTIFYDFAMTIFFLFLGYSIVSFPKTMETELYLFERKGYYVLQKQLFWIRFLYQLFLSLVSFLICNLLSSWYGHGYSYFYLFLFFIPFLQNLKQLAKGKRWKTSFVRTFLVFLFFLFHFVSRIFWQDQTYLQGIFYGTLSLLSIELLYFLFLLFTKKPFFFRKELKKREEKSYTRKALFQKIAFPSNRLFLCLTYFLAVSFLSSLFFPKSMDFFFYQFVFLPVVFLFCFLCFSLFYQRKITYPFLENKKGHVQHFMKEWSTSLYVIFPLCFLLSFLTPFFFSYLPEPYTTFEASFSLSIFEFLMFFSYSLFYQYMKKIKKEKKFFFVSVFSYLFILPCAKIASMTSLSPSLFFSFFCFLYVFFLLWITAKKLNQKEYLPYVVFRYKTLKIFLCAFIMYAVNLNVTYLFPVSSSVFLFVFYVVFSIFIYALLSYKSGLFFHIFSKEDFHK